MAVTHGSEGTKQYDLEHAVPFRILHEPGQVCVLLAEVLLSIRPGTYVPGIQGENWVLGRVEVLSYKSSVQPQ